VAVADFESVEVASAKEVAASTEEEKASKLNIIQHHDQMNLPYSRQLSGLLSSYTTFALHYLLSMACFISCLSS